MYMIDILLENYLRLVKRGLVFSQIPNSPVYTIKTTLMEWISIIKKCPIIGLPVY